MNLDTNFIKSSAIACLGWLLVASIICWVYQQTIHTPERAAPLVAVLWLVCFWSISVLDLFSLAKFIQAIFSMLSERSAAEKKAAYVIRALSWGIIKLGCFGLFGLLLLGATTVLKIPVASLVLGLGTLFVVPLLGGALWGQKILGISANAS